MPSRDVSDRWRQLSIERSPGLIGVHDLEGNILYMNPAATTALGHPPDALNGMNFAQVLAPSVVPYFAPAMERLLAEKSGEGLMLMITKSGQQRRWWYRHILIEDPGEPPVVFGDSTDITEVHSASEALEESEQRFRYLAENIHQVFWVRDPRTSQILYLSPAFEEVWGRSRGWIIEQPWLYIETVHPDDRMALLETFAKSAVGESTQSEYRILRPDGSERWISSHAFPVRDRGGAVARIVAITEDITERKQAEDALRRARDAAELATQEKSLLMAHVSHEVRTPLNIIFGLGEMLLDTQLDDQQRHDVERIVQVARTLNALSNDLLDFSKVGSRTLELRRAPFEVAAVLESALEAFVTKPRREVAVSGEVADDVPRVLVGDPDRLRQVLTNLLGNANKFTEEGSIVARIEVAEQSGDEVLLRCTVRDTGPGIAVEDQRRIFQPFLQAKARNQREVGGVGLGLAICAELVKLLGGDLWLESVVGQGSTFGFTARLQRDVAADECDTAAGSARIG